eukprot:scaffold38533_cov55-Phaeocystis_antarctica.AAC.2
MTVVSHRHSQYVLDHTFAGNYTGSRACIPNDTSLLAVILQLGGQGHPAHLRRAREVERAHPDGGVGPRPQRAGGRQRLRQGRLEDVLLTLCDSARRVDTLGLLLHDPQGKVRAGLSPNTPHAHAHARTHHAHTTHTHHARTHTHAHASHSPRTSQLNVSFGEGSFHHTHQANPNPIPNPNPNRLAVGAQRPQPGHHVGQLDAPPGGAERRPERPGGTAVGVDLQQVAGRAARGAVGQGRQGRAARGAAAVHPRQLEQARPLQRRAGLRCHGHAPLHHLRAVRLRGLLRVREPRADLRPARAARLRPGGAAHLHAHAAVPALLRVHRRAHHHPRLHGD